jgi:hypothetical protein
MILYRTVEIARGQEHHHHQLFFLSNIDIDIEVKVMYFREVVHRGMLPFQIFFFAVVNFFGGWRYFFLQFGCLYFSYWKYHYNSDNYGD